MAKEVKTEENNSTHSKQHANHSVGAMVSTMFGCWGITRFEGRVTDGKWETDHGGFQILIISVPDWKSGTAGELNLRLSQLPA